MILDNENKFSVAQSLTGTSLVASTDYLDLSVARQIGAGKDLYLVINIDTAAGGTSPTLSVAVQTDDNTSFSSATTILTSPTYTQAQMAASSQLVLPLPLAGFERYLRLGYTQAGTSPTVTLSAHIVENYQQDTKYASGFSVQ